MRKAVLVFGVWVLLLLVVMLETVRVPTGYLAVQAASDASDSWVWVRNTVTGAWGEAVVGTGDAIYIARKSSFYRYRPADNSWMVQAAPPNPDAGDAFKTGTALAWDFGDYIYVLYGAATVDSRRWFYRYSISGNSWQSLANTPYDQGEGDTITWVGLDNSIYATIGGEQRATYFLRYDPSTNSWSDAPADPPAGMGDGASLIWTGSNFLYALRGEFDETSPLYTFWRYSVTYDVWTTMADIPAYPHSGGVGGVGDGGSLLYIGLWLSNQTDFIYALSGNQASPEPIPDNRFYRYTISTDSWEGLADLSFGIGYYVGCRLGYADGHIYGWQGTPSTWAEGGDDLAQYEFTPITVPRTWIVDDDGPADFSRIQDAINVANQGDNIYLKAGTYYEHVVVNKSVLLIGEDEHNTIIDGSGTGTVVEITANNVNISKFTIQNGFWGIDLGGSNNIVSSNNVFSNKRVGILLGGSNNTFRDNNITGSQLNLYLYSWATSEAFNHDIDPSNTVDGKPIYYLVNQHNQQIPQDAGYVATVNCTNITLRNLNLQKNIHGVFFVNTNRSTVENVTVIDTVYGIFLRDSSNNAIYKNTVSGLSEMTDGIRLEGSGNNVSFNTLSVENGIGVYIHRHSGNTVSNNNITECGGGIRLDYSEGNIIHHNNFIGNTLYQAILYPEPYNNTWDDGYPFGGNYWSDYTGVDEFSGPYQNETGSDGIGDTTYVIDENNRDRYPLMSPYVQVPVEDLTPPNTLHDYDGLWHNTDFTITLSATDDLSGVAETYYKINDGLTQNVSTNGQPFITTEGANNTLEYWSVDVATNEETHHVLTSIKLDKTQPVANAGQSQTVNMGKTVTFDAGGSTDNVGITSYEWDFGDETTGTGITTTHTYTCAGAYTVTLTVKDAAGNSAADSITITVLAAEGLPMWIIGAIFLAIALGTAAAATILWKRRK